MLRTLWAVVIAAFVPLAAHAQPNEHPSSLAAEGSTLSRVGQATRVHLLGAVELYSLALYVEGSTLDRARLVSPEVAKALRIEVRYEEDLRRRLAVDWRRELIPRLEADATEHLGGTFASLREGHFVLIEYVPGKGTTIRVNKSFVVSGANHDLMLEFLDHWLGQRPVSEEIKRALLTR